MVKDLPKAKRRALKRQEVFYELREMLTEIIGIDAAEIVGIHEHSTFLRDLEMSSIQIVELVEMVQERYGEHFDFIGWLTKRPILHLIRMNVGEVAALIEGKIGN
jgi:acyl carrier protein